MKAIFHTNIDAYNEKRCFSEHMTEAPRKGDMVEVLPEFESYYRNLKLPNRLEVTRVTWKEREVSSGGGYTQYETYAYCDLWYNATDLELAKLAGGKPLG